MTFKLDRNPDSARRALCMLAGHMVTLQLGTDRLRSVLAGVTLDGTAIMTTGQQIPLTQIAWVER